jgi:hypothetical protein
MSRDAINEFYARQAEREREMASWPSTIDPEDEPDADYAGPHPAVTNDEPPAFLGGLYRLMIRRKSLEAHCESPIEVDFAVAFLGITKVGERAINPVFAPYCDAPHLAADCEVLLVPQWPLGGYRYDFLARYSNGQAVLVECDGRQFHSSQKQTENDRRKDAAAQRAGIMLFRFQGKSLFRDAHACASKVWWQLGIPS